MGIPRWTQDLTPYLEVAIITKTPDKESALIIRNIIIDGPSMVYHVYSSLVTTNYATAGTFSVPTYQQLNGAIDVFLTDLESCGAKIERIFFDGALPISKRRTRLDRLEKSRIQLEHVKSLALTPTSLGLPQASQMKELSQILWQTKNSSSRGTSLTAPLIVPSAIEYLRTSKWHQTVYVVCGEAETFCASGARELGAAVLSNDSDFTLLADMQDKGIVGMLHSLSASHTLHGDLSAFRIQCWRPKQVRDRLGTDSLVRVGFERSRDPTISFATVLQRSAKRQTDEEATEFASFTDQFRSPNELISETVTKFRPSLSSLDPRLAELICQLTEINQDSALFRGSDLWVTLPILLEDPSKDASWSYGRKVRQLAYSLLFATYGQLTGGSSSSVTESIRKGQRITQDLIEVIDATGNKIRDAIRRCIADLGFLSTPAKTANVSRLQNPRDYVLWALVTVLNQRATAGKSVMPPITIREYLELSSPHHHPYRAPQKSKGHKPDSEAEWRLLHLNANVQSVLYSLRVLSQTCVFLKEMFPATSYREEFMELLQILESMPPIQSLFLDIHGMRTLMRKVPLSPADRMYKNIFPEDVPNSKGSTRSNVEVGRAVNTTTDEVVNKKRKKHRKHASGGDKDGRIPPAPVGSQNKFSKNPFDLLMEE